MPEGATQGPATGCQLSELFRLLGERHVPDIVNLVLQHESVRFTTIQNELNMSPNTLSQRLKRLVAAGLVTRHAYQEIPPRVEYVATDKARELSLVFETLSRWAERHTLTPEAA
jgi:DNA-binding HxlR family transcriptional regulator